MLSELEREYPNVFVDPFYPMLTDRTPFIIPLIDPSLPPKHGKQYPLSYLELDKLKVYIKGLVGSGRMVPSGSLYGAPILFAENKRGGGLWLYIDY